MTQPGRLDVDKDLAPDRRGDLNVLYMESVAQCIDDKRLHTGSPPGV
jgi:hypothetical protein